MSNIEAQQTLVFGLAAEISSSLFVILALESAYQVSPKLDNHKRHSVMFLKVIHAMNFKHNIETSSFHQTFNWTPRNVTNNYSKFRFCAPLTLIPCGAGMEWSKDKSKDTKMCSVLALVEVGAGIKLIR
eukprot:sb/3475320/